MMKLVFCCLFMFPLLFSPSVWMNVPVVLFFICFFCSLFCFNPMLLSAHVISSGLMMDQLSWSLIMLAVWLTALSMLASQKIYHDDKSSKLFVFFLLLLMLFLILAFSSCSLILFYFFFESSLVPILFIVLLWGYQPERLQAGLYMMMYTLCGSLPLLIGLVMIYLNNGHTSFFLLLDLSLISGDLMNVWSFLLIFAFLVKLPLYGVHLWLPKAHVEAPVAGSMMLAGVLLKLGAYGLLRVLEFVPKVSMTWSPFFISFSLMGAIVTSFICLRQCDFKSLIAYSSVAHMGLLISGVFSYHVWGWQGALFLSVAHGLSSSALFMLANMIYTTCLSRSLYIVKGMQNLFPFVAFWWFIFCISNMAAPPTLNLLSEIMLMSSIVASSFSLAILLAILAFMGAAYSLFLFVATQHGHVSLLMNPLIILSINFNYLLFLHVVPIVLFIFSPILLGVWCF